MIKNYMPIENDLNTQIIEYYGSHFYIPWYYGIIRIYTYVIPALSLQSYLEVIDDFKHNIVSKTIYVLTLFSL